MDILYKKNTELSDGELEAIYSLHYSNVESYATRYNKFKNISSPEYKQKWTNYVRENNNLICIAVVNDGYLIGFTLLILEENENYISDFYIAKEYQHDGQTFRALIENTFKIARPNTNFTGRIWNENTEAKTVFQSLGARIKDGKYVVSYSKIKEWIEKKSE